MKRMFLILAVILAMAGIITLILSYSNLQISASSLESSPSPSFTGFGFGVDGTNGNESGGSGDFTTVEAPTLPTYGTATSWESVGSKVLNIVGAIAVGALVLMLLIGGVMYITSSGNEEQAGKAQKTITAAIVGIVIASLAWGTIAFVLNMIK